MADSLKVLLDRMGNDVNGALAHRVDITFQLNQVIGMLVEKKDVDSVVLPKLRSIVDSLLVGSSSK